MFAPISFGITSDGLQFEDEPGMYVFGYVLRPESRGRIRIASADPATSPKISPEYLTAEDDRQRSVAVVRQIRRLMSGAPIAELVKDELPPTRDARTDEEILDTFRRFGEAGFHACGACAMGQDAQAVVDERLRVRGVAGLRVMDTSIYPEMLSGNTNAPTMALAWRASDLILQER
jgi:choline dehydrogenase-like flavoprotein